MRGAINKEERFMKKLLKSVAALSLSAMMLLSFWKIWNPA